jgi:hypothetical protein
MPVSRLAQTFQPLLSNIENHGSTDRQQRLSALIHTFHYGRRKRTGGPPNYLKTEIIREVSLEPEQARLCRAFG